MPQNLLAINGVLGLICAVGERGQIVHFTDGAPVEMASPTTATLRAVSVVSPTEAWAVGDDGTTLWWDGSRWYFAAMAGHHDKLLAVACGDGEVWVGGDGRLILHRPNGDGMHVFCLRVVRSIACAGREAWFLMDSATIMHSDGNGAHFFDCRAIEGAEFNAIAVGGREGDLFAVGQAGAIVRQDGEAWIEIDADTEDDILCAAADGPHVWIGTRQGEIRHSADNGATWELATVNVFGAVYGLCIVGAEVWAVGDQGVVLRHLTKEGE